jgi:hypothetical protein
MYHQAVAKLPCLTILHLIMPAARSCSRTGTWTWPVFERGLRLWPIHQVGALYWAE